LEEFNYGNGSLKNLLRVFNYPSVDEITRLHQVQHLIDELADQDLMDAYSVLTLEGWKQPVIEELNEITV
jgi:hypothetical protein